LDVIGAPSRQLFLFRSQAFQFTLVLTPNRSTNAAPLSTIEYSNHLSRACLIAAIAAVEMKTSLRDLQKVGGGAIGLVASLTAFLAIFVMLGVLAFG
jgi:uncharacterized membrane protein YadS